MKHSLVGVLLCALCWFSASFANAGDFTTDPAQLQAADCGNSFGLNLASLVDANGASIPMDETFTLILPDNQFLGWGTLSQPNSGGIFVAMDPSSGPFFVPAGRSTPLTLTLDPANGLLNGFCFRYGVTAADIQIYDGDTLIDSITTGLGQAGNTSGFATNDGLETNICWDNTNGDNVTRIVVQRAADSPGFTSVLALIDGEFHFDCDLDPEPLTCFEQMSNVGADATALLAITSDPCDAYFLEGAIDCIDWMQSDIFWEQPSGNRLSQYGGSLFIGAAYTVYYLECVDDPAADVLIDDLLAVLECIVDNEIAYAIENGGSSSYIENAEHFAELGNIIDDDFDNQFVATLAYRLAWLHAYYATQ